MARRHEQNEEASTEAPMTTRLLRDAAKQPGLIPSGVWVLRAVAALKVTDGTPKEGEDPYKVAMLTTEPFEATDTVDPEEVTATDASGRSTYDGKYIFTRFTLPRDERRLAQALLAFGLDGDEVQMDLEFGAPIESARVLVRGKFARGDVGRYSFKDRVTGEERSDNQVKTWAPVEA